MCFIPSSVNKSDKNNKINTYEAKITAQLLNQIYQLHQVNGLAFTSEKTVGIITPYRSQIALIKREIHALNIPQLNAVTIDTVERYQGSQRDIIIYSFSVNQYYQLEFLANYIEDDGQIIDRKLNVAITRARKQLFITGNPSILSNNPIYFRLIEFIRSRGGYINCIPQDFIEGRFTISYNSYSENSIDDEIYSPSTEFEHVFNTMVIQPIKGSPRTKYPELIYGNDHDYNRLHLIQYGRANFDQESISVSTEEKVNLYCYYNMRKHYFSSIALFKNNSSFLNSAIESHNQRVTFIDLGCGPLTSGLAFYNEFKNYAHLQINYFGIDISKAMIKES